MAFSITKKADVVWDTQDKKKLKQEIERVYDNEGNVHVLFKVYHDVITEEKDGKVNYHYTINSYYKKKDEEIEENKTVMDKYLTSLCNVREEIVEHPIITDKYLVSMSITINDENELICTGLYYDKYFFYLLKDLKGYCYYKIDIESKELVIEKFNEFESDYIKQNGLHWGTTVFDAKRQLILCEDGGVIFITEAYNYLRKMNMDRTSYYSSNVKLSSSDRWYYGSIFIIKYTPNGNIEWKNVIYKKQEEMSQYLSLCSYAIHITKEKVYIFINDHINNFDAIEYEEYRRYGRQVTNRKSMVVVYELSMDGKLKKEALFDSDFPFFMDTKQSKQISEEEFKIYGHKNSGLKIIDLDPKTISF